MWGIREIRRSRDFGGLGVWGSCGKREFGVEYKDGVRVR